MAGITRAQAESQLATWLAANEALSRGQSYRIGDRELTKVDAADVLSQIEFWDAKVKELSPAGRPRIGFAVPL